VRWGLKEGNVDTEDRQAVLRVLDSFEKGLSREGKSVESTLRNLQTCDGVEVFAMSERILELSLEISPRLNQNPFDECILAAVLGRGETIRDEEPGAEIAFCELDQDLQPWTKDGQRKSGLCDLYNERGIWVYGDFNLENPIRPDEWPLQTEG
jgi:hypothetical protein